MTLKMENRKQSQIVSSPKATSELIALISDKLSAVGLLSYMTICKVHWAANVATFCLILCSILQVITIFMAKGDPDWLFECLSILAFCCVGIYKITSLRRNQTQWRFLLNQISILEYEEINLFTSDAEYQSEDEGSNIFSKYVHNYTERFKKMSTVLQKIYGFTVVLYISSPFLEYLVWKVRGLENLEMPHILPEWAPLDFHIIGYLLTVSCEVITAIYCVSFHTAFDLTVVGIMIFICGQFTLLRDYCARIGGDGKYCNLSKKNDDRASFRIKHCHRINMILINSVRKLDKLLKNIIGLYYFLATLTLCSVAIRIKSSWAVIACGVVMAGLFPSLQYGEGNDGWYARHARERVLLGVTGQSGHITEDMTSMKLITLLQYMCGTLTQLFLFCYYGDAVLNESAISMGQGPFASAYWCISPPIRRDLTLLSISMVTPRHLHAGPFNYIDLPSFISVIRAAYSYYAVLGQKK